MRNEVLVRSAATRTVANTPGSPQTAVQAAHPLLPYHTLDNKC
jgi:hypothetical protein